MYLNPLAGALGLLRWALGRHARSRRAGLAAALGGVGRRSASSSALLHFRRSEREFADII